MLPFHPMGNILAEFGFAAVVCLVPEADKAKIDNFHIWPDLGPTNDLFNKVFKISLIVVVESFPSASRPLRTIASSRVGQRW